MYLERCNRKAWGYKDVDIEDAKENNPALYNEIKPFLTMRGKYISWESIFEEAGYWRKANAIHKWFVDCVQDGEDDCGCYEVTKEQLEELLDVCIQVRDSSQMEKTAQELLPTQSGFFFGSTEYDEWYVDDLIDTISILTKVLKETDFDNQMVVYTSSW
jgi:hypothetical protein